MDTSTLSQGTSRLLEVEIYEGIPRLIEKQPKSGHDDAATTVVVEVVDEASHKNKPFLGGFRNLENGVEYHHASTQMWKPRAERQHVDKFHRDTQTVETVTRSSQCIREAATQMARPDLHIDERNDRVMIPQPYFTSEDHHRLLVDNTVRIQCFIRRWKARRIAAQLRGDRETNESARTVVEENRRKEAEERREAEINRRMHPKTKADFELLFNELEAWRLQETRRIKSSGLSDAQKQEQLKLLLKKETKLLQTIHRLKVEAQSEAKESRVKRQLQLMSSPKKWEMGDGQVSEVLTPFTDRARALKELFEQLQLPLLMIDERLDVLLRVKWSVKEFDCALTRDLVDLIDREADLLSRGRSEQSLRTLRKRISSLFLQFVQTPEFNPEAARFQRVPYHFLQRPQTQLVGSVPPTPAP